MEQCSPNENTLSIIEGMAENLGLEYDENPEMSLQELKQKRDELLEFINKEWGTSDFSEVSTLLDDIFSFYTINDDCFSKTSIENHLNALRSGVSFGKTGTTTTEELFDHETNYIRNEASNQFLNDAYGSATDVKEYVIRITNNSLFDSLFVNRGSIVNAPRGVVENSTQLNDNIRAWQQQLFDSIVSYLQSIGKLNEGDYSLFDIDRNYTGILDNIRDTISQYLSPIKFQPNYLRELYNRRLKDPKAKLQLDAYNAWVILKNFDDYLSLRLGDSIDIINNYNRLTTGNKYKIADKTNEMVSNWRTTEDIILADEIDKITQLAITTTPLYNWDGTRQEGKYLQFQHFTHVIGKLKELGRNPDVYNIRIGEVTLNDSGVAQVNPLWETLSDKAKEFFTEFSKEGDNIGMRLSKAINIIRKNPREYIPYILELITSREFYDTYKDTFFKKEYWKQEELNYLYTINRGLFSSKSDESINKLVGVHPKIDYMDFLSQTADAVFKKTLIQYYVDEKGVLQTRFLLDLSVDRIGRQIRTVINNNNGVEFKPIYEETIREPYNITPNLNTSGKLESITFTIPNTDMEVTVYLNSGELVYKNYLVFDNEGVILEPIKKFLDNTLKLHFDNRPDLLNTFMQQANNEDTAIDDLIKFASRVLLNQYVQNVTLNGLSKPEINSKLDELYGKDSENRPVYSNFLGQINLVSDKDTATINALAIADATNKGLLTSSQVKDSEQSGQSVGALSHLLGSTLSQRDLIELEGYSATKHFFLLTNPEVFEGHASTIEYYNRRNTKKAIKFSEAEFFFSQFMGNFVTALVGGKTTGKKFIESGHAGFLASVNSDKGTIGQLKVNLNSVPQGYTKAIKDFTTEELTTFISKELGTYFRNVLYNVTKDWAELTVYLSTLGMHAPFDYLFNFESFNKWFYNPANNATRYGKTPVEFVRNVVKQYNLSHRLSPLQLIDNVHFIANKNGRISNSNTLISSLFRFAPQSIGYPSGYSSRDEQDRVNRMAKQYYTEQQFWQSQRIQLIKSYLKHNTKVNLLKNTPQNNFIKENYKEWVTKDSMLAIAKITYKGNEYLIADNTDIEYLTSRFGPKIQQLLDHKNFGSVLVNGEPATITINPLVDKFNLLDYLFTSEWLYSNVGSFLGHPSKAKLGQTETSDLQLAQYALRQEASQFLAQHKRNVSFTAQMHPFLLNTLTGIPEDYNIAVIQDTKEIRALVTKLVNEITPYDGGTFVNPFIVYLENNSLGGAKAGITKKPFVHFKHGDIGTGGIIKTAGFGLTNDWMRNSPLLQNFMQMMTDHDWLDPNGNSYYNVRGKQGEFRGIDILNYYWQGEAKTIDYDPVIIKQNGKFYSVRIIPTEWNGVVKRELTEVDSNGNPKGNPFIEQEYKDGESKDKQFIVNSNYKLWQLFGGVQCYELTPGRAIVPSERSITNVVKAMNLIGYAKTKKFNSNETYSGDEIVTQEQLWQPLKQVDVNYLVTAGAIKQGQGNINPNTLYDTRYGKLDILRIKMYQAGIQLDKEHHADDSEIALPTQIVSACASKGYSYDHAVRLYKALEQSTEIGIKSVLEALRNYVKYPGQATMKELTREAFKIVLDNLSQPSTNRSMAQVVAEAVMDKVKQNKDFDITTANFPLSDNIIFNKALSSISSYLTRQAIRLRIPGILSVLTPSYGIFKLWGDRKFESFTDPNKELEEMQLQHDSNPVVGDPIYRVDDESPDIFNTNQVNSDLIEYEFHDKPWRNDPSKINKTIRVYLKGQKERGYFELVKDNEEGYYSVHFKPQNPDGTLSWDPNSFSSEEKALLFQQLADLIPEGSYLSTWGELSRGGIAGVNRFLSLGFEQVGTRQVLEKKEVVREIPVQSTTDTVFDSYDKILKTKVPDSTGKVKTLEKHILSYLSDFVKNTLGRSRNFSSLAEAERAFGKQNDSLQDSWRKELSRAQAYYKREFSVAISQFPQEVINTPKEDFIKFVAQWGIPSFNYDNVIKTAHRFITEDQQKSTITEKITVPVNIPILRKPIGARTIRHRLNGLADLELGRTYKVTYRRPVKDSTWIDPGQVAPIIITGASSQTAKVALEMGGIDVLRHPDSNGMHFGNPFSHTTYSYGSGQQTINMGSAEAAGIAFEQWLRGEAYQNVEPERRQWIVNQINNGSLRGKPIIYYTAVDSTGKPYNFFTHPNHAHILQKLIYEQQFRGKRVIYVQEGSLISPKDKQPVGMRNPKNGTILVDIATMRRQYAEKAYLDDGTGHTKRNPSEPLPEDFTSFDEFMTFCLTHELMYDWFKQRGDESNFEYETRINTEALKEIRRVPEGDIEYEYIQSPRRLRELYKQIQRGEVTKVVEYVKDGRDLGAYNVRFYTIDGRKFQLWQLDSLHLSYDFDDFKQEYKNADPITRENAYKQWYQTTYNTPPTLSYTQYNIYLRALVQRDLENLSTTVENRLTQFNRLLTPDISIKKLLGWLKYKLPEAEYNKLPKDSLDNLIVAARRTLEELGKVSIDGVKYTIIPSSIEVQPYEVIMPKTFKTEFGFDTYTDLLSVKNNRDYFIDQYFRNKELNARDNQYDIVLRVNNGNHYYILDEKHLQGSGLTRVPDEEIRTQTEGGKTYRVIRKDGKDKVLYEILPGTVIYTNGITEVLVVGSFTDENGNEVKSIDTIDNYVSNLSYSTISFSEAHDKFDIFDLVKVLKKNLNCGKYISKYITPEDTITEDSVLQHIAEQNDKSITLYNWRDNLTHPQVQDAIQKGRAKHTSFLKSLEIVAARIPSQSMQSYMAMKVVAFDNPNRNTAHVSTLQLLLQGSDLDIDAVSLVTYDIDSNGMLQIWSPYACLQSLDLLNESLKLPTPTGEEINFTKSDSVSAITKTFTKFRKLFALDSIQSKRGVADTIRLRPLTIDEIEQLQDLKTLLETETFYMPDEETEQAFIDALVKEGIIRIPPEDTHQAVSDIFEGLKKFIDEHNLYLTKFNHNKISRITNNSSTYSLYESVIDPVNQTQAQESVDGDTTKGVKDIANSQKAVAEDAAYRTGGNFENKAESIKENQEGKDCLAISAVGIKGFFTLTQYFNTVLNEGTPWDQSKLVEGDHKKILANIRAKDPATVTNEEVLALITSMKDKNDVAITLSALLGLAADNAKELALPKLNASQKMIGMYLYAISIGEDFRQVSKILMSDVGLTLKQIMDDDVFVDYKGYSKINDVFDYFNKNPYRLLNQYNTFLDTDGNSIPNPYNLFNEWCLAQLDSNDSNLGNAINNWVYMKIKKRDHPESIFDELDAFAKSVEMPTESGKALLNQLMRAVKTYVIQYRTILSDNNTYKKIKEYAEGASLMRLIGQIAGLNQGLKGELDASLTKVGLIEDLCESIKEGLNSKTGQSYVDLPKFATNKSYRKTIIDLFGETDAFVNVPHMIDKLPHLLKYVETLAADYQSKWASYRFRSIANLQRKLSKTFKGKTEDIRIGISNYVNDKIISSFLLTHLPQIKLPKGSVLYKKDGTPQDNLSTSDQYIQLGTDLGNASFRHWFEYILIPELQRGELGQGSRDESLIGNKFIQDLSREAKTNTLSGNETLVVALPINMMARNESEETLLKMYKAEFNKLTTDYTMPDGTKIPLIKLFAIYSMIANNWRQDESSLVPIFEDQLTIPFLEEFRQFETDLDQSGLDISQFPNLEEEIKYYIASKEGPYSALGEYTWGLHPDTQRRTLMTRLTAQDKQDIDWETMGRYIQGEYMFVSGGLHPDAISKYFTKGFIGEPKLSIAKDMIFNLEEGRKKLSVSTSFDLTPGTIGTISTIYNNKVITIQIESEAIYEIKNNNVQLKTDIIKQAILDQINGCNG